jgi:hypothetical protein
MSLSAPGAASTAFDFAIELLHGEVLRPIMVRLADEGVPLSAIARATKVPLAAVHETVGQALSAARLLQSPPADWPPGQLSSQRQGRRVSFDETELTCALQHRFGLTRQQTLLLMVMLKRKLAAKDALHAAAQAVHAPGHETCPKLVEVVVCKLRKRMKRHGYQIHTVWASGYFLSLDDRKAILKEVGVALAHVEPKVDLKVNEPLQVPVTSRPPR